MDRNAVVIRGDGMDGKVSHVFQVTADDFTLGDVTIGWVRNHAIQVHGERGVRNTRIHNVRLVNAREQLLKISQNRAKPDIRADGGIVEWSSFEFADGYTAQSYAGGISAIGAANWVVRHNRFDGIRSPRGRATGPAILFWQGAENTRVESNIITRSDRGIQFGLGRGGHRGGIVANNFVHVQTDVGIGLEGAVEAKVYNNSVFVKNYPNAIEYRFEETQRVEIANNLVNRRIVSRDGGQASLQANVERARAQWFIDATTGDLRLSGGYKNVVDQGYALEQIADDIECDKRPSGPRIDVGADEFSGVVDLGLDSSPESKMTDVYYQLVSLVTAARSRVSSISDSPSHLLLYVVAMGAVLILVIVLLFAVVMLLRRNRRLQYGVHLHEDE